MKNKYKKDYSEAPAIGNAIETNTKSYDRIYGMLLGIRIHAGRISANEPQPLNDSHFNEYEKIDIPREGNHYAPAHHGNYDYKFKTYAPNVFRHLRLFFGISDEEYLMSLTADYMMSELKTIGRSGAMFFYTWDGRYVLKTLTKGELALLKKNLKKYYQYVTNHPDTLVNQFFGIYRSQTSVGRPIRFVIMNNVFPIGFQLRYKFDLKGSTVNRFVPPEKKDKPGVTMKDAEFAEKHYLSIGPRDWALLRSQLYDDTNFLANCGLMDYSLLIGVHQFNPDSPIMHPQSGEKIEILSVFTPNRSSQSRYNGNSVIVRKKLLKNHGAKKKKIEPTVKSFVNIDKPKQTLEVMPFASSDNQKLLSYCGGLRGSNELDEPISEVYFIGIIDFLQGYNTSKKTEHAFKSLIYQKDQMSCIPPDRYDTRMYNYLCKTIGPEVPLTQDQEMKMLRRRERLSQMAQPIRHSINSISLQKTPFDKSMTSSTLLELDMQKQDKPEKPKKSVSLENNSESRKSKSSKKSKKSSSDSYESDSESDKKARKSKKSSSDSHESDSESDKKVSKSKSSKKSKKSSSDSYESDSESDKKVSKSKSSKRTKKSSDGYESDKKVSKSKSSKKSSDSYESEKKVSKSKSSKKEEKKSSSDSYSSYYSN